MKNKLWLAILLFPMLAHAELTPKDIVGKWDCRVPLTDDGMAVQEQIHILADNIFQGVRHQTVPFNIRLEDGKPFPIAFNYRMETSGKWKLAGDKLVISDYVPKNVTAEHDATIQKWLNNPPEWISKTGANLKVADAVGKMMMSEPIAQPIELQISIQGDMMKLVLETTEYCQRIK